MKANSSCAEVKIVRSVKLSNTAAATAAIANNDSIITALKLASLIKKPSEDTAADFELYSTPAVYNNTDNNKSKEMLCVHDFNMPVT